MTKLTSTNSVVSAPVAFVHNETLHVEIHGTSIVLPLLSVRSVGVLLHSQPDVKLLPFLEYLRFRPRNVACLCNLGVLKIAVKNYSEAEYFLEKALAIESESGLAHYLLGRTYYLQGKLDDALAKLEKGLTFDPQNAKAHNTVGVISTQKGWVARAEKAFTSAVSINPKYGDAHFNLAVLYVTRDEPNPKAAEKHYFEALHLGVPRDASIENFLKEAEAAGPSIGMLP